MPGPGVRMREDGPRFGKVRETTAMVVGSTPAAQMAALYERDFVAWTRRQAAALRAAQHGGAEAIELDHEHLAQEIERLGERARSCDRPSSGSP